MERERTQGCQPAKVQNLEVYMQININYIRRHIRKP